MTFLYLPIYPLLLLLQTVYIHYQLSGRQETRPSRAVYEPRNQLLMDPTIKSRD